MSPYFTLGLSLEKIIQDKKLLWFFSHRISFIYTYCHFSSPPKKSSPLHISLLHICQARICAQQPFIPLTLLLLLEQLFPSMLYWWCSGQPSSITEGDSCGRTCWSGNAKKLSSADIPHNFISFFLTLLQKHASVRTGLVICHFINRFWLLKIKMMMNEN